MGAMHPMTLEGTVDGQAVRLRPHRSDDVPAIVEQCRDPEMVRWTRVPDPFERAHAVEFVERIQPQGWRDTTSLGWAVEHEGRFCGTLDLRLDAAGGGDLGFGLGPWARGKGLLPAALRLALPWAFEQLHLEVVRWQALVGNWSSRRAVWKVGFSHEGIARSAYVARGRRHDVWQASLLAGEPMDPATSWYEAPVLAGALVRLRPWRESDAARVVEACADPVSQHWLAGLPRRYGVEDALAYLRSREEEHAADRGVHWCVADPSDDRCLGSVSLLEMVRFPEVAEVGYWAHPAARGRGIMTEAVRLVARHAFAPAVAGGLGLRRLVLQAAAGNTASQLVAQRSGFVRSGLARAAERLGDGSVADLVTFDRLPSEPPPKDGGAGESYPTATAAVSAPARSPRGSTTTSSSPSHPASVRSSAASSAAASAGAVGSAQAARTISRPPARSALRSTRATRASSSRNGST
jgi:[ribosomal protein S5]-alanine N-acetyltransferase